jgi:hypothetical protein
VPNDNSITRSLMPGTLRGVQQDVEFKLVSFVSTMDKEEEEEEEEDLVAPPLPPLLPVPCPN